MSEERPASTYWLFASIVLESFPPPPSTCSLLASQFGALFAYFSCVGDFFFKIPLHEKWKISGLCKTLTRHLKAILSKSCLFVLTYFKNPSIILLWWQHNLLKDLCSLESITIRMSKARLFVLLVGFLFVCCFGFFHCGNGYWNFQVWGFFFQKEQLEISSQGLWYFVMLQNGQVSRRVSFAW